MAAATALRPGEAAAAAAQVWPPFVLVAGLLLIGVVANEDGLFAATGHALARGARRGAGVFAGAVLIIAVTTAVLNLDTTVAFLTPVLIYTARSRGGGEDPLLYGAVLLANAGSLFLPGSNLTNLIVLGQLHLTGGRFFLHTWAPGMAALLVTAGVVAVLERRTLSVSAPHVAPAPGPVLGLGALAVVAAAVLVLVLPAPALPVAMVGVVVTAARIAAGRQRLGDAVGALGAPVLVGLFGIAVAMGTVGRAWSGPAALLAHLDAWGTAGVAALAAVAVNNLPAASLLAAHHPAHPYALVVGLDVGPNLFVTGSLAWFLWYRAARSAGARPSFSRALRFCILAGPLALVGATSVLLFGR